MTVTKSAQGNVHEQWQAWAKLGGRSTFAEWCDAREADARDELARLEKRCAEIRALLDVSP